MRTFAILMMDLVILALLLLRGLTAEGAERTLTDLGHDMVIKIYPLAKSPSPIKKTDLPKYLNPDHADLAIGSTRDPRQNQPGK